VEPARIFLAFLGIIFAVAGLFVSWTFDPLAGVAVLLIGAFLLILPLITYRSDE
jgi:ABC-type Mn2+/Zn2+ transport system permease subunit